MKKILSPAILVVSLFFLLLSCKEEDNTESNKSNLLGDWDLKSREWTECKNPEDDTLQSLSCTSSSCMKYSFVSDTTNELTYYISTKIGAIETIESGFYTVSDDKISLCQDNEGNIECEEFQITIQLDNLILHSTLEDSGCFETITLVRSTN